MGALLRHWQQFKSTVSIAHGHLGFIRMPYDLRNAIQKPPGFVNRVLLQLSFAYTCVDYRLMDGQDAAEHKHHADSMLDSLDKHGVIVNPVRYTHGMLYLPLLLHLLGHHVDSHDLFPLSSEVPAIPHFPSAVKR
ncbi:hypothetical protein SprV_0401671400 [Sparganum proliferum]